MSSILDTAKPVEDYVESINMVIYGDSGVGKTRFAGSGKDKGKNDLLIAIDHGTVSAAQAGSKVNVIPAETLEEFEQIVSAVIEEPDRFDWVIVDSVTKLQDLIWKRVIDDRMRKRPGGSPYQRELQEYGEVQNRLIDLVQRLNDSDANIIWTAQSQFISDEEGQDFRVPSIHGQKGDMAMKFCQEADIVCYMSIKEKDGRKYRHFQFDGTPGVLAKSRFNFLVKPRANFTLEKLTSTLEKESNSHGS